MANKPSTILKLIGKAFVACGWDGSDWQAVNVDSAGDLQVDVKSTALPAGAATEAKQDDQIVEETAIKVAVELIDDAVYTGGAGTIAKGLAVMAADAGGTPLALKVDGTRQLQVTEASAASILAKLIAAPSTAANQEAPITASAKSIRLVGPVTTSWATVVPIDIESDAIDLSAIAWTIYGISGLTAFDWYLSWDTAGGEPITDRVSWTLATDMMPNRAGPGYVATAKVDIITKRPAGTGTANTCYLHIIGTGGTATYIATPSWRV